MTALGDAFRSAVEAHVGNVAGELVPDRAPTTRDLFDTFGSNEEIARAAGYGAPGQHAKNTPAWRRRRTFMRNLQRYRQAIEGGPGQRRHPGPKLTARLQSIVRTAWRARATPSSVRDVVRMMGKQGTTTTFVIVKFRYSSKKNPARPPREIDVSVYSSPTVYREVDWPMRGRTPRNEEGWNVLGLLYLEAYAIAYGLPEELVDAGVDEPLFMFSIGREEGVEYDYE